MKKNICVILCLFCFVLHNALCLPAIAWGGSKKEEPTILKGYVSKIPTGTKLRIILETPIDEITSMIGDEIVARTSEDISVDGETLVPAGSTVVGSISEINFARRPHRAGSIRIEFKNLTMPDGRQVPIVANVLNRSGLIKGRYTKKTALISSATLLAPAAAGFGVGLAAEGSPLGGTIGAALGVVAGIALFAFQKGNPVDVKSGDEMDIELVEEALIPTSQELDIENIEDIDNDELVLPENKDEETMSDVKEIDFTEPSLDSDDLESEEVDQVEIDTNEEIEEINEEMSKEVEKEELKDIELQEIMD